MMVSLLFSTTLTCTCICVDIVIMLAIMSGVTVAVAVVEDSGGLGGIETDDKWNSITNDMIAFDDMTSTTMDDSMINDMIDVDAVTSTTTTTYDATTNIALECILLRTELECENTECCTWRWSVLTSTPMGSCSNNENDGCPIVFCGYYFDEFNCENAEECCTWSSSLSMCSGSYGDCSSPFLDDISPTDDNKVNDFTTLPTYDEMTLTPTSDWRPSSINDGDDDDGDTRNKIILGSVIGVVCVIFIGLGLGLANQKKKRSDVHTPSDQFLNTTVYGGLDVTPTTSNGGPTPIPTTRFDFEAGVAARADAVASFNNHTAMTHEPTTTTTTDAATVTKDNHQLKEGKVKGTTTAATTKGVATTGPAAVAAPAILMAEVVPSSSVPSSSTTATNVHRTETAMVTKVPVAYATEASAEDMPAPVPVDPLVGSEAPKKYIKWKDGEGLTLNPKYKAWMTANGNPTQ